MPIRTSVKVSVQVNGSGTADKQNGDLCDGQGEPRKSHTVLSNWTSGRPPDSVMDFRLTFEEGQARLFVKLASYT